MKKVLIVEPNPYHNEVVPGIALYFEKLGYQTEIMIRMETERDGVFCRCSDHFHVLFLSLAEIRAYLRNEKMMKYDFLFLSSMEFVQEGKTIRFLNWLDCDPVSKYGVLGIYHTVSYIKEFGDFIMAQQGRLFCLSEFQSEYGAANMLNCHYFGKISNKKECGTKQRTISVIGIAAEKESITQAVSHMPEEDQENLKIILVGEKKKPIWVKTRRLAKLILFSALSFWKREYRGRKKSVCRIEEEGYVNFEKMYEIVEHSDFILVMINPENPNHKRYLSLGTSGIMQLIYGFHKVCLIRREVAEVYGFSDRTAVLYEKGQLTEALKTAVHMSCEKYCIMKQNIAEMEQRIFDNSMENLKKTIETIQSAEG